MADATPTPQAAAPMHRRLLAHPLFWPLLALALLLLGNGLLNPGFLALEWRDGRLYGNLVDIANRAAPLILVSLGMTLVIAVRGLDISVGAVLAIAATVAAWTITRMTAGGGTGLAPLFAAVAAALAAAALCGLWNGVLVVKVGMQPIIATLILMVAGRGVAQLISGGNILTIYYPPYSFIGTGFLFGLPFALYVVAAVFIAVALLLDRTALMSAGGDDQLAAFFARAELRRNYCDSRSSFITPTPRMVTDWIDASRTPGLRGLLSAR